MTREEAIEYWDGLRKTFSSRLEKEENCFGRMHLQTTIDVLDVTLACIREQEERRWIPVTERLPESNMPVLVYCTNITIQGGYIIHIGSCDMGKFWFLRTKPGVSSFPVLEWQVTHWMPLPEPPKEDA